MQWIDDGGAFAPPLAIRQEHSGAGVKTHKNPRAKHVGLLKSSGDKDHRMEQSIGMRQPVRVLLVDNSIFTLHGLKAFLSNRRNIVVVGAASTEAETFAAIQAYRPDVVILDVRVGHVSGIDLCKAIRKSHPNIGVLVFTAHEDKTLLHSAILAGAQGYLLKTAAADTVAKSIEIVSTGQAIMDQQLTQHVIAWVRDGGGVAGEKTESSCSREDRQLLSFLASGKTNKEIAQALHISPSAVNSRLQKLYKRLRISRRSEAARYFAQVEKD